jgi:hypothetical protein
MKVVARLALALDFVVAIEPHGEADRFDQVLAGGPGMGAICCKLGRLVEEYVSMAPPPHSIVTASRSTPSLRVLQGVGPSTREA